MAEKHGRALSLWIGLGLLLAPAWAGRNDVVAVVVEVKGQVTAHGREDPPSRVGTQLKLLSSVIEGQSIKVENGGKLTLSFTKGGVRATLNGPVEGIVRGNKVEPIGGGKINMDGAASSRDARLAPRASMDLSRMGGVNARATCNVWTDQTRPQLSLDVIRKAKSTFSLPAGQDAPVYYRDLGAPGQPAAKDWVKSTVKVTSNDHVEPAWDLKADHSYYINFATQPADSDKDIDYSVRVFSPAALSNVEQAIALADKPGPDQETRQIILISLLDDCHLYERALERAEVLLRKHPQDSSLKQLVEDLNAKRVEAEGQSMKSEREVQP